MPTSTSEPFAPRWLRCAGCVVAMTPLPGMVAVAAALKPDWPASVGGYYASAVVFLYGFCTLINGHCPPPPRGPFGRRRKP